MAGQISVHFETLEQTARALRAQADRLQQQLVELKRGLEPMAATWTGMTFEHYTEYWRQISTGMQNLFTDIDTLGAKAHSANELQQANERTLAAKFGG